LSFFSRIAIQSCRIENNPGLYELFIFPLRLFYPHLALITVAQKNAPLFLLLFAALFGMADLQLLQGSAKRKAERTVLGKVA
jgi:hypothetical protein